MDLNLWNILILEKNKDLLEVLEVVLIGRYQCVYVGTLDQARKLLVDRKIEFHMVITEDILPDGSGLDLVLLCNQDHIPCVGISESVLMKGVFFKAGVIDFLVKPVDYDRLLNVVWGVVGNMRY